MEHWWDQWDQWDQTDLELPAVKEKDSSHAMSQGLEKGHKVTSEVDEGELERRGIRCQKEAEQKSVWMRLFVHISTCGICRRLLTQLDTSSALPRHETEKFSKQQKNKSGILAPRCRAPNFVQITILTLAQGNKVLSP